MPATADPRLVAEAIVGIVADAETEAIAGSDGRRYSEAAARLVQLPLSEGARGSRLMLAASRRAGAAMTDRFGRELGRWVASEQF